MMFSVIPVLVVVGFIVVLGMIVVQMVQGVGQWHKNNESPVLDVTARVVAKRANVSTHRHHHAGDMAMSHTTSSTTYYVTFEVQSGDRVELCVSGGEYGMLVEGDSGMLTFQGTRYLGFKRG